MLFKSQAANLTLLAIIAMAAVLTASVELDAFPVSSLITSLALILFCIPSFLVARQWLGKKQAYIVFAGIGFLGLAIETFALQTGFPYGRFDYSSVAGIELPGGAPWTVAFGWTPLVLAAFAVAAQLGRSSLIRILLGTMVLTALDVVLDPGAVAVGLWSYRDPGIFYGVPLQNFLGWTLTSAIVMLVLEWYTRTARPLLPIPVQLASSGFLILFFWTVVALATGLVLPALIGWVLIAGFTVLYRNSYYSFDDMIVMVDAYNRPTATERKLAAHNESTQLHRAFSVFLFNRSGELLLQRRSSAKKTWPDVWSNSCCGHTMLHESVEDAARRRLRYELGINVEQVVNLIPNFAYRAEKDGIVENEICPILLAFTEEAPRPNPDEVSEVRWISWANFVDEISSDPSAFSPWAGLEMVRISESPTFFFYLRSKTFASLSRAIS